MTQLEKLRPEASAPAACAPGYHDVLYAQGLAAHFDDPSPIARAHGHRAPAPHRNPESSLPPRP